MMVIRSRKINWHGIWPDERYLYQERQYAGQKNYSAYMPCKRSPKRYVRTHPKLMPGRCNQYDHTKKKFLPESFSA